MTGATGAPEHPHPEDGGTADLRAHAEAVLRETRQCYIAIDDGGVVRAWNRSASRMFGYTATEALGASLSTLIVPPAYRETHDQAIDDFVRTGHGRGIDAPVEVVALRSDGAEIPVELTIWAQKTPAGHVFHALGSDLTERRSHERVLRVLAEHRRRLLHTDSEEEIRQLLVDTVHRAAQCDRVRFHGLEDHGQPRTLLDRLVSYDGEDGCARVVEPVVVGDRTVGVLVAEWTGLDTPPAMARDLLLLLAGEAAAVLQRLELQDRLAAAAHTDSLTGLPNRRAFDEALRREVQQVNRDQRPLTLVLIDLDRFKVHNDTHGHPAGDDLLRRVSAAWRSVVRAPEMLARVGGDEFALVLPGSDVEQAAAVVERLVAVTPSEISLSAGAAAHVHGEEPDVLLQRADGALYARKRTRR